MAVSEQELIILRMLERYIYSFHVPLFFFISGLASSSWVSDIPYRRETEYTVSFRFTSWVVLYFGLSLSFWVGEFVGSLGSDMVSWVWAGITIVCPAIICSACNPGLLKALKDNAIEFIDMVCVNLYPFRQTISKPDVKMEDAIENIDIGGPSMLRSAAKNYRDVTVVCDPEDYARIIAEIKANGNT